MTAGQFLDLASVSRIEVIYFLGMLFPEGLHLLQQIISKGIMLSLESRYGGSMFSPQTFQILSMGLTQSSELFLAVTNQALSMSDSLLTFTQPLSQETINLTGQVGNILDTGLYRDKGGLGIILFRFIRLTWPVILHNTTPGTYGNMSTTISILLGWVATLTVGTTLV
jgi:hypothetical protein